MIYYALGLLLILSALAAACFAASSDAAAAATSRPAAGKRVIGYYAGWAASRGFRPEHIRGELLTHVNYAFARVGPDHRIELRDPDVAEPNFAGLRALKEKHPHLRTLISVGGWTDSTGFYAMSQIEAGRAAFSESAAAFASRHGFDGVDLDWEYPGGGGNDKGLGGPADKRNFTLLLQELRRRLDEQGAADRKRYLSTIAVGAGARPRENLELDEIHKHLDFINLMTYDMGGTWSPRTAFNAPLLPAFDGASSADGSVRAYLAGGIPTDKLVLGVPFYGRGYAGVAANADNGFNQPHDRKGARGLGGAYRDLAEKHIDKTHRRFWHDAARVPWLYDETGGTMITYDDPESLRLKGAYAREQHLGGVMIWELSEDDEHASLLTALNEGLREEK
jgi:chitinase